jgi:dTMP kinase
MQQPTNQNYSGKLIVIDGTDGSGKATQAQLLTERLKRLGYDVALVDFPQYGKKSAGLVEEYLNGKFGTADEVGPYRASMFYASDRYDASFQIRKWLEEGKIVITNRYVTANMGHQGGKISDAAERQTYFNWLYQLEYEQFGIPKPDLNLILHVDAAVAQQLVDQKGHRDYVGGQKRDIHEADLEHLRNAEKVYLEIAQTFPGFQLIECSPNGAILDREAVSWLVWQAIAPLLGRQIANPANPETVDRPLTLKIERITPTAKLPSRSYAGDAGLDLYADQAHDLLPGERKVVETGIKMALPKGHAGLVWDKSGVATQGIHTLAGVIDENFRGPLAVVLVNLSHSPYRIEAGQKVAQLLVQKVEAPVVIEEKLSDQTARVEGRFGSSGLF